MDIKAELEKYRLTEGEITKAVHFTDVPGKLEHKIADAQIKKVADEALPALLEEAKRWARRDEQLLFRSKLGGLIEFIDCSPKGYKRFRKMVEKLHEELCKALQSGLTEKEGEG